MGFQLDPNNPPEHTLKVGNLFCFEHISSRRNYGQCLHGSTENKINHLGFPGKSLVFTETLQHYSK